MGGASGASDRLATTASTPRPRSVMVATIRPDRRLPWFSTVTQKRAWDVGSPVKRTRGVKVAFVSSRSGRGGGVLPAP